VFFLTISIITLFGISALGLYFFMRHAFYQQIDRNLIEVAEDFIHETERSPNGELECEFHELNLEKFSSKDFKGGAYYELRDHRGEPLIRSASLTGNKSLPYRPVETDTFTPETIKLPGNFIGRAVFTSFPLKLEHKESKKFSENTFKESYNENDPKNRVYLTIAEDPVDLRRTLFILASALLSTGIILTGTIFLLVKKIVASAFFPILKLTKITEDIGPNNLQSPLPLNDVPIEFLPLIIKFNQALERLDDALSRERRFSIDLAHELRTPVTEIRNLMEVSADTAKGVNADDPHDIYLRGSVISARISKIIEVITAIYQENPTSIQLNPEALSIRSILSESIARFDEATQARFCFTEKKHTNYLIETDPSLLRAIIDNLLTNAAVHSPANSLIKISCLKNGFTILNETNELEEEDLPSLSKAFWQKDSSRTQSEHFGLGLTLVAVYLRLLKGQLNHRLENRKFSSNVTLPFEEQQHL
jgi:two-component system sensor histidine kinase QseC